MRGAGVLVAVATLSAVLVGCSSKGTFHEAHTEASVTRGVSPASPTSPAVSVSSGAPTGSFTSADGYSFVPPVGWKEYPAGHASGLSVIFIAPSLDPAAKFVDNINVVITPNPKDLRTTVTESKQAYPRIFTHYRLVVDEPATANGRAAYLVGGTFEREGLKLGNLQMFLIVGAKQYTVTFTSPAASFPRLRRLAQASLLSFRLT